MNKSSSIVSSEKQMRPNPKVIVIKKKLISKSPILSQSPSPAPSSTPSPVQNNKSKTSSNQNKETKSKTRPQTPKSFSQDKVIISKQKSKTRNYNILDQPLTKQLATKTISPIQRRSIKSNSKIVHKVIVNKKKKNNNSNTNNNNLIKSKLSTKTALSNQSNPSTTLKQLTQDDINRNKQMRKISNYFGKIINKLNDEQLLIQEKFTLTDIRLSKIETAYPNIASHALNKNSNLLNSSLSESNIPSSLSNEQLETNWNLICQYFTMREMSSMIVINKSIGINTINHLIVYLEHEIESLEENITLIRLKNHSKDISHFSSNSLNAKLQIQLKNTTLEAIKALNDPNCEGLFSYSNSKNYSPSDTILFIYKIYFVIIQRKLTFDEFFWNDVCNYFSNRPIDKLGAFVENDITKAQMTNGTLYNLDRMVFSEQSKIFTPEYFKHICAVTGIFAFILKDVLENIGLNKDSRCDTNKSLMVLNAKLEFKNKTLMRLNKINQNYFN